MAQNFGERLCRARSAKGMSQSDLAKASGIASAQISRYERGVNTPRPHIASKLAAVVGIDALSATTSAPPVSKYDLSNVATADLLAELGRRCER